MEFKIGKKELRNILMFVLAAIVFYWVLHETDRVKAILGSFMSIFAPFLFGGIIAFILNVPVRFFEKRLHFIKHEKVLRVSAVLATLLSVVLVIAAVVLLLIPQINKTIHTLMEQLPHFFQRVNEEVNDLLLRYPEIRDLLQLEGNEGQIEWMKIVEKVMAFLETSISGILNGAVSLVSSFASAVFNMVVSVVFSFYCLTQKETLARIGRKLLYATVKEKWADEVVRVARMTNTVFSNFLTGQCLEAIILGLLFVPAMALLRMPYIPLICVVIAVTALVPLVGAFVGCVLGAFFIMVNDPMQAVVFVLMFLVIQQIEGNLIYPRVVGKSIGLPGMWVLLAVAVGGGLMGIPGMLLFVPMASVIYTLLEEYTVRRLAAKEIPEEKLVPQPPELQPHFVFKKVKEKAKSRKKEKVK